MQRSQRPRQFGIFRSNELPRLVSMIVMLGVLILMIDRARDPSTWTWLTAEPAGAKSASPGPRQPTAAAPAPATVSAETLPAPQGPTDEDPEEIDAAKEEFQAITDGTLSIQPEEMPSYKRMLRWVESQPDALLRRRAQSDVTFTDLYQTPEKYRGRLIRLELNVGLVNKLDKVGGARLCEVWGWTNQSKGWMYDGIAINPPADLPIGEVHEKATLFGYFFKLQGYQPARAKPGTAPERAPLVIGRLVWQPSADFPAELPAQSSQSQGGNGQLTISYKSERETQSSQWYWGIAAIFGIVLLAMLPLGLWLFGRRRRSALSPPVGTARWAAASLEGWLDQADTGRVADDENLDDGPAGEDADDKPSVDDGSGNRKQSPDVLDGGQPPTG